MILIALGGNRQSARGLPEATLRWALAELPHFQVAVNSVSGFYRTAPVGVAGQAVYVNAVASVATALSPDALLRTLKRVEKAAGREQERLRTARRWDARPLDLDIIDYRGQVSGSYWNRAGDDCSSPLSPAAVTRLPYALNLPHPFADQRPFVIRPLLDVAPLWHHPVTHRSARSLWTRLGRTEDGQVLEEIK